MAKYIELDVAKKAFQNKVKASKKILNDKHPYLVRKHGAFCNERTRD